jgi:ABC-type siderophore export system fused ATPase/permease subunit
MKTETITLSAFWFKGYDRTRLFVADENKKPKKYENKTATKTEKSLLNKYMKLVKGMKPKDFKLHIKDEKDITDYQYFASGPSYSERHCYITIEQINQALKRAERQMRW